MTKEKIYRLVFWGGYLMMITAAFIPLKKDLFKITLNIISFKFHFDQVLHAVVYMLICIYFFAGQYFGLELFKKSPIRKFLIAVFALATITEVVQLTIPYRTFNLFDIVANITGILSGILLMRLYRMKAKGVRR